MRQKLSDTEYEIMQLVWQKGGDVTSGDICRLAQARGWKAPTVLSFLNRLCGKGFLQSEKTGKQRSYTPLVTRDEYARSAARALARDLYGGRLSALVAGLSAAPITPKDRAALEKLLDGDWGGDD